MMPRGASRHNTQHHRPEVEPDLDGSRTAKRAALKKIYDTAGKIKSDFNSGRGTKKKRAKKKKQTHRKQK